MNTNPSNSTKDKELIDRLRLDDGNAFEELVRIYSPKVMQKAYFLTGRMDLAEEAAQEIFLKAFRDMKNIRGERIFPWLSAITYNHCMDILRKKAKTVPAVCLTEEASVATNVGQYLPDVSIEILKGLTPVEKTVVFLRLVENLHYDEISEITGLAVGSMRNTFSKALRKLREEITAHRK